MQPYDERAAQLTVESSVAVWVLLGNTPGDLEMVPLKPRMADEQMLAELKARWPGRGLDSVGVLGLVGTTPKCALRVPLEPEQVSALAAAFLTYLQVLFHDSFAAQMEAAEIAELEHLMLLPDTRPN